MRLLLVLVALLIVSCGPAQPPAQEVKKDPAEESWYAPAAAELSGIDRKAEAAFQAGDQDGAAAFIEKGKAIEERLLAAKHPTLAAMEAASDLDQLYGQMLLVNNNCGWATQFFQKNVARWKRWTPEVPESVSRLALAQKGIADCERRMTR